MEIDIDKNGLKKQRRTKLKTKTGKIENESSLKSTAKTTKIKKQVRKNKTG